MRGGWGSPQAAPMPWSWGLGLGWGWGWGSDTSNNTDDDEITSGGAHPRWSLSSSSSQGSRRGHIAEYSLDDYRHGTDEESLAFLADDADDEHNPDTASRHVRFSLPKKPRGHDFTPKFRKPVYSGGPWFPSRFRMYVLLCGLLLVGCYVFYLWRVDVALGKRWKPDPDTVLFSQKPLSPPSPDQGILSYELPLRTQGRDIVDQKGRRFKLHSVNWYGASDELFVPGGLDVRHRDKIAATIRQMGFNSVRLPYADELVVENPVIEAGLVAANPDLAGRRALDVLEAVVTALTEAGVAVILNDHITHATWCCGADPCDAGWANDHLGPLCRVRQTERDWIRNWETVMLRFVDNPLVIGADLRNEVRGVWGTMPWSKWAAAAERAGNALLRIRLDWLIIVGGTESGNDVSGARGRPVVLDVPDRVVYSAHVYAWSGWGSLEGRFSRRRYGSFARTMTHNWGYLLEDNVAPVWVGEFGASRNITVGGANYWQNLFRFLKTVDADFGYWAINPRKPKDNEKETYALVKDDWETPILDFRMKDMTELMRQAGRARRQG